MYNEFLARYTKSGTPIKDLSRFASLMHRLGDPQDKLRFIHVAGTNGKGSAVRMLSEIFTLAGYTTGEFTSPFIYHYNDRIKIDGKEIPDEDIERFIKVIEPCLSDEGYSQFEITNAIAFLWYVENNCDAVILEAGMGGLLDSTNIIKNNICSVIMSVSLDHTAVLGNTTAEIAAQKAGIIKDGCPCVLYPLNDSDTLNAVEKAARKCASKLIIPDTAAITEENVDEHGCRFLYKGERYKTSMAGRHQIYNAVTAAEAAHTAIAEYDRITDDIIKEGIFRAAVPSRMQIISGQPEIIIDGAHNPDAMKRLADFVSALPHSPKIMVCGMNSSKDHKTALSCISPYIDHAYCIDDFTFGTVSADEIAECFTSAETATTKEALYLAKQRAGDNGLVVIAGSLYIASAIFE